MIIETIMMPTLDERRDSRELGTIIVVSGCVQEQLNEERKILGGS
jgi:hypothetical protein